MILNQNVRFEKVKTLPIDYKTNNSLNNIQWLTDRLEQRVLNSKGTFY